MKRSFYEMLEVPRKATQNQIDNAFARLTEQLGATTSVRGTAESLTQINMLRDGYRILSDPEKRAMYDAKLHASEAGIKLMFFPKDTKAVKKLGIETIIFSVLACAFTYVVYQKLIREQDPARIEQAKVDKGKADGPAKPASPVAPPAIPAAPKAVGKSDTK